LCQTQYIFYFIYVLHTQRDVLYLQNMIITPLK